MSIAQKLLSSELLKLKVVNSSQYIEIYVFGPLIGGILAGAFSWVHKRLIYVESDYLPISLKET